MPSVVPARENSTISTTIRGAPRPPRRAPTRPMPASIAPLRIVMVMKTPMASTNRNTPAAPKSSPTSYGPTKPVSVLLTPYSPFTGARNSW